MNQFLLSVLFPLKGGAVYVLVLRVAVEQSIEWVKRHADEIAQRAAADDKVGRSLNGGQYAALWVEVAPC